MTLLTDATSRVRLAVSTITLAAALGTLAVPVLLVPAPVEAQSHSGGAGGSGGHDDGHDEGDHEDGHTGKKGKGGSGGHEDGGHEDDDHSDGGSGGRGKGPQAGGSGDGKGQGGAGGKPVWAQEGIPEVELGRLNVARAPEQVLDRAYVEALSSFTEEVAAFYRLELDEMEDTLKTSWESVSLIDSPVQNLALLRDALDGTSVLRTVGVTTDNDTLLAAFLGTASDKTVPVTKETAIAVSAILGHRLDDAEAAALAAKAEQIRRAILEGHG